MTGLKSQTAASHADRNSCGSGEWALVHKGELAGFYDSFETAWNEAALRFGRRRCLVRQISAFPMTLTVSADNLKAAPLQKWKRLFSRQIFAAGEASS